jgi:hypothetical protein
VRDVKDGVFTVAEWLKRHSEYLQTDNLERLDERKALLEIAERTDENVRDAHDYPEYIMLDSGAFTGWNKGHPVTIDEVREQYDAFLEIAGDMFKEIWLINLDKIPGERGRDPTPDEFVEAIEVSDRNYETLVAEYGDRVLPVFHQGEDRTRLHQCAAMVDGKSDYICVSPRNDVAEIHRVRWSEEYHSYLHEEYPFCNTHGLATTGVEMIRRVPWYSGDSAAWVQHGGFGMIDIVHESQTGKRARYKNYFITSGHGHDRTLGKHVCNLNDQDLSVVKERVSRYGFTLEELAKEKGGSRLRNLVCMGEIAAYAEWSEGTTHKRLAQQDIFA